MCLCDGRYQTCKVASLYLERFRSCEVLKFPCCHMELAVLKTLLAKRYRTAGDYHVAPVVWKYPI